MSANSGAEKPARPRRALSRTGMFFSISLILGLALVALGLSNLLSAYKVAKENIDLISDIKLPEGSQATRIWARDFDPRTHTGTLLGSVYIENRINASYSELPPMLIACLLSTEDKNFYTHTGVDIWGTARAIMRAALRGSKDVKGTSTLSQQLSRNVFLPSIKRDRTLNRKVQEFILAGALEQNFSKQELLEAYVNYTYFGNQSYGVKAAAKSYFGKDNLSDLTLEECALLAGLPQKPSGYDPYDHPQAAKARREIVLDTLARRGADFYASLRKGDADKFADFSVPASAISAARSAPLALQHAGRKASRYLFPYFTTWFIRNVLIPKFGEEGASIVGSTGMDVVTTIDPAIQQMAEATLKEKIDKYKKMGKKVTEGAIVVVEAHTGEILAAAGGYEWHSLNSQGQPDEFNRAMLAHRQTGSSFKPFTYATAYEQGFPTSTMLADLPLKTINGKPWPTNSDHRSLGIIPIFMAMQHSRNCAAVDLMVNCTGIPAVIETAHRMGITEELPEVESLTLGVVAIKPCEMAEAYDTFPNFGRHVDSITIKQIYNQEGILIESDDNVGAINQRSNPAFSKNTGWTMVKNMMLNVEHGTGTRARVAGVQIGGKTGTCDDFRDSWFCGYSPELVCVVWCGNDNQQQAMNRMFGGDLPAETFAALMKKIYTAQTVKDGEGADAVTKTLYTPRYKQLQFKQPAGVTFSGFRGGAIKAPGVETDEAKAAAEAEKKKKEQEKEGGGGGDGDFYEPWHPRREGDVFF